MLTRRCLPEQGSARTTNNVKLSKRVLLFRASFKLILDYNSYSPTSLLTGIQLSILWSPVATRMCVAAPDKPQDTELKKINYARAQTRLLALGGNQ